VDVTPSLEPIGKGMQEFRLLNDDVRRDLKHSSPAFKGEGDLVDPDPDEAFFMSGMGHET
jgi:hypothetical protein